MFAFCFLNFMNVGLIQTNTFLHPFELLKLRESGIFERLGAKLIYNLWTIEGEKTDYIP